MKKSLATLRLNALVDRFALKQINLLIDVKQVANRSGCATVGYTTKIYYTVDTLPIILNYLSSRLLF